MQQPDNIKRWRSYKVLDACFEAMRGMERGTDIRKEFSRFCDFVEAIVAYHRYYKEGGD